MYGGGSCFRETEKERHLPVWPVSWAEQDGSCRAGCASHSGNLVASAPCLCHMRQSLVFCTSVLEWGQETTWGCCPFPVWSTASLPSQPPEDMATSTGPKRPHSKYSLLGKTHCPFDWGLIFHYWNLYLVLIKYLNVLHHLPKQKKGGLFSLCPLCSYYQNPLPWHTASSRTKGLVLFCRAGQQQDLAQSTSLPVQPWCKRLLSFPVTLPNSRLCFCATASE